MFDLCCRARQLAGDGNHWLAFVNRRGIWRTRKGREMRFAGAWDRVRLGPPLSDFGFWDKMINGVRLLRAGAQDGRPIGIDD